MWSLPLLPLNFQGKAPGSLMHTGQLGSGPTITGKGGLWRGREKAAGGPVDASLRSVQVEDPLLPGV